MKSLMWNKPVPLTELENVKLPQSFSFITDYVDSILCAVGITSTHLSITWNELKMVNEGFN